MGNNFSKCFIRDKISNDYINYDTYIYCRKCMKKIKYNEYYIICNIYGVSCFFCCRECYYIFINRNDY